MIDSKERARRFREARGNLGLKAVYEGTKAIDGTGVSPSMISELESWSYDRPVRYQKVLTLAEFYHVNVAWLIGQPGASRELDEDSGTVIRTTGLSDNSIDVLRTIKGTDLNDLLNRLLESDGFADMLFQLNNAVKINENNTQTEQEAETIESLQVFGIINGMDSQNSRLSNRQLIDMYRRKAIENMNKTIIQILKEGKENGTC